MRRLLCGLSATVALCLAAVSPVAATTFSVPEGFDEDGRLVIAAEPDTLDTDYVIYHRGGEEALTDHIVWGNGRAEHGKAVDLSGGGDYLSIGYDQLRLTNFSVSLWVNWRGAAEGGGTDQPLLTLARDEDNMIAVSPDRQDASLTDDSGNIANGLFLEVTVAGEREVDYKPSALDSSTALPQGEWHHLALVAKQPNLSLYLDGKLWAQTLWSTGLRELNANFLRIGGGLDGTADSGTLNALVDDVEVYAMELNEDQLLILAAGGDPLDPDATVPTASATATAATEAPTEATISQTASENPALNTFSRDPSLWLALTVGGCGLGLFLLLTVFSLIFGKKKQ